MITEKIIKRIKLTIVSVASAAGLSGIWAGAMWSAKAVAAVDQVEFHERRIRDIEVNAFITCLAVKQLIDAKAKEGAAFVIQSDEECKRPSLSTEDK